MAASVACPAGTGVPCRPPGVSVAGVCRYDGNDRRDSGREDHEAWDRGPHKLHRDALSEGGRGCRGGATSAPD